MKIIIGRHAYGALQMDGAKRLTIALSPDGAEELEQMATCSKSAVVDLAVKVLGMVLNPRVDKNTAVIELVHLAGRNHNASEQLCAIAANLFNLAQELEMHANGLLVDLSPASPGYSEEGAK